MCAAVICSTLTEDIVRLAKSDIYHFLVLALLCKIEFGLDIWCSAGRVFTWILPGMYVSWIHGGIGVHKLRDVMSNCLPQVQIMNRRFKVKNS